MTTNGQAICSRCGSQDCSENRYAVCSVRTIWPVINTNTTVIHDDLNVWNIFLCNKCIPESYSWHLKNQFKLLKKSISFSLIFVVLGGLSLFIILISQDFFRPLMRIFPLGMLIGALPAMGVFFGITLPVLIILILNNRIKLKKSTSAENISSKIVDRAFQGEAERIMHKRAPKNKDDLAEKVYGEFKLPEQITAKQANDYPGMKSASFGAPEIEREILATGKTIADVERKIKGKLKKVWKEKKDSLVAGM